MNTYVPRPGSKTEAAIQYIRAQGGQALAVDICEEIDIDRKNLPATFKAAVDNGLLEPWDLPNGVGYCLCGSAAVINGVPRARKEPKATDKERLPVAGMPAPEAATEIRPYLGEMPKVAAPKKPRKPKAAPAKSDQREDLRAMVKAALAIADHSSGPGNKVATPTVWVQKINIDTVPPSGGGLSGSFRVAHYSDGSVRLEGLAPEMIITDGAGALPNSVMLTPEAARLVARFIGSAD